MTGPSITRNALSALLAVSALASPAGAQTLSADRVDLAERFELHVQVGVPPGSVVYFPDTIPSTVDVESFAPVRWRAERTSSGGAELTLTYTLFAFGAGAVAIPGIDVITAPVPADVEGASLPGGSVVGAWADAPRGIARDISRVRSPDRTVWVRPVQTSEDIVAGVSPRGPDDVVGLGWSPWTVFFLLVFTIVLVAAVAGWARGRFASRPPRASPVGPRHTTLEEARFAALAELERIASASYATEAEPQLYAATSGAVRGYVERFDPEWGPGLTSTELMDGLRDRHTSAIIAREMQVAEHVKFGRHRKGGSAFASHLGALRAWLSEAGRLS